MIAVILRSITSVMVKYIKKNSFAHLTFSVLPISIKMKAANHGANIVMKQHFNTEMETFIISTTMFLSKDWIKT